MRLPDGSRIDIGIYLFFAPAVAFTLTSASAFTWALLPAWLEEPADTEVELAVAAVVLAVAAVALAVVAFAVEAVAPAVEVVVCAVARVAAAEALSALLTDGVLRLAAELTLVALERPRPSWAKEWLEIAKEAMMIEEVIARRFIIPDLIVR